MINNLLQILKLSAIAIIFLLIGNSSKAINRTVSGCSDAGIASASEDSVCYSTPVTLSLSGYTGTVFQWQSFDGTNWIDETGTGSNTDSYLVTLTISKLFRALVTQSSCPADTSNEVNIVVGTIPVASATSTGRCGPGLVNLQGSGAGTLKWYSDQVGGNLIATGSNTTAFIPASTTLWVSDNVLESGGTSSPLQITETVLGNTDYLEIQNVSPIPVDVTGWKVLVSDDYANINTANANIQVLSGILQPGDLTIYTDAPAGPNYWGSNIMWNPGTFPDFTGWAMILDSSNNLKDFVVWGWPTASIQSMSITVGSTTIVPSSIWSGDGVDASIYDDLSRIGTTDNDVLSDFTFNLFSIGVTNPAMTLPFTGGFGCISPRIPVQVIINSSDSISINATATAICQSGSAAITASSNNSNYIYNWSPSTGLNTTTGSTVISTPLLTTTYIVIGDDGTCSNVDTITIAVGFPTVPGLAETFLDTVCLGKNTDLVLTGSVGNIQWQHLNGSVWVDETGPGADSTSYTVSPTTNTTYRAFVSSVSCPADSSNTIDIAVLSINDPVTTGDSICGNGSITLTATGQGLLNWYNDLIDNTVINSGPIYTFNATVTDTFYVDAFGGTSYNIGPVSAGIGSQSSTSSAGYGVAFDVIRPVIIEYVYVYPLQTGNITINLRNGTAGPVLATYTASLSAFTGKVAVPIGFSVPIGTGYKMEIAAGGISLLQNTSGAVYPYTIPNGPLYITGYYNPNLTTTGTTYLWLYDWVVAEGCRSARVPVVATVNSFPVIPTITQNWNFLTSSSPTGNQWLLNGSIIPGATSQTYEATQVGNYTVAVTINGCTTLSAVYQVLTIGLNEIPSGSINIFPNPVNDVLNISLNDKSQSFTNLKIIDVTGRVVYQTPISGKINNQNIVVNTSSFTQGIYMIELKSKTSIVRKQLLIQR